MPRISVIVPVYKVEPYLRRCVDSILAQTFTDFELILVDDGSPDGCPAICDEYAEKDRRAHVIHQKNRGLSAARNAGIDWAFANSDSQWLSFVDSDDWVHPLYFEALLSAVQSTNSSISICTCQKTEGRELNVDEKKLFPRKISAEKLYADNNLYATIVCGKLYQKKSFEKIRFPIGKIHEDEYVTYRILFEAEEIALIDEPLYAYFNNNAGITKSSWTPYRLSSVEAIEMQINYMKRNGYKKGFQYAIKKCANNLVNQLIQIESCEKEEFEVYIPVLRRKLKRVLICHRKAVPLSENQWIYEFAFPYLMQIYWMSKAQIDKIDKIAGKR